MRRGSAAAAAAAAASTSASSLLTAVAGAPATPQRASSASEPPPTLRGAGFGHDGEASEATFGLEADVDLFRRRLGFLGLLGVAFTCSVFLMLVLRPVLEPFMWALFLVIALHPITSMFEYLLLGLGRMLCGCSATSGGRRRSPTARSGSASGSSLSPSAGGQHRRCPMRPDDGEIELQPVADSAFGGGGGGGGLADDDEFVGSICGSCCECLSRVVAVACSLAVVLGVAMGVAMFIFEGAIRLKENFAVYELGARNAVEDGKEFFAHLFGQMPRSVVDEISDNALSSAKGIVSDLLGGLLSHAATIIVELLMLGLYVMFWLCTPMPLNSKTERIFRRYLFLKGFACICYGLFVGIMLRVLEVELAAVFGLMSFFFSFIPEVGAFFAMALPVPVILFDSRLEAPFLTLIIATAGQLCLKFVFANIIEVKLVENDATMKMHPVITLLAVTFFGFVWGPTGMLLSVPIMAYLKVVVVSDRVPAAYRDPVLVLLEGDRRAPDRHRRRRALSLAAEELAPSSTLGGLNGHSLVGSATATASSAVTARPRAPD